MTDRETLIEVRRLAAKLYHDFGAPIFSINAVGVTLTDIIPKLMAGHEKAVAEQLATPLTKKEQMCLALAQTKMPQNSQMIVGLVKQYLEEIDRLILLSQSTDNGLIEANTNQIKINPTPYNKHQQIENTFIPIETTKLRRVLVVEDEPVYQLAFSAALEEQNCEVLTADDGLQALNIINNQQVELIFMDIRLPNLNGFDATIQIRKQEKEQQRPEIPIIGISDSPLESDRQQGLMSGMTEFVAKTHGYEEIASILNRYIQ